MHARITNWKRVGLSAAPANTGRGLCAGRGLWSRGAQVRTVAGLFLLVVVLAGGSARAQAQADVQVTVRVSADSVKVGERFTVTLVAEHAADASVHFPASSDDAALFGDVTVLGRGEKRGRTIGDARAVDSVAYRVATFALDSAHVPILPVRVVTDRDTAVVGSAPRVVPVISVVPADAEGLRVSPALAHFPRPLWVWAVLGGIVVLLGGLAYAWWRRRATASEAESPEEAPPDPYEAASARLQQLTRRNPNDRETCKAFYVELTETLRVYLARRVGVRALECTTPEVVAALRREPEVSESAARRIQDVLERADLVKFADAQPEPSESRAALRKARGVLDAIEAAQRRAERTPEETPTPA